MFRILIIAGAVLLSAFGCKGGESAQDAPVAGSPSIALTASDITEKSVKATVTLKDAEKGYVLCVKDDAGAPTLQTVVNTGRKLTASGDQTYGDLEPLTAYTVYAVASRGAEYCKMVQMPFRTLRSPDDVTPQGKGWRTTASRTEQFAQVALKPADEAPQNAAVLTVLAETRFQTMEGFGPAITGSAAYNLLKMPAADRARLLKQTFSPAEGLGYSYVRVSIGCSDFSLDEYTCCDTKGIEFFELHEYDKRDLFPVLHEILAINPDVKILGSPWTCPRWMKLKVNSSEPYESWTGGRLNPAYHKDYAEYFVNWIEAMEAEGFPITAITVQNEPLNEGNSASMRMTWEEQRDFIKTALGPAFSKNGITTKIWAYDHNYDQWSYPLNIYKDAEAAKYIDGSAWHAYGGNYKALEQVQAQAPDKNIYFTEQSIGDWCPDFGPNLMWHMREVCLGPIGYGCRAVMLWNFMLDAQHGPWRPGGCNTCYGFVDLGSALNYGSLTYRSHYFAIGHLSKVIRPGATRIGAALSRTVEGVMCAAFENPDGSHSVVLSNDSQADLPFIVRQGSNTFSVSVPAGGVISLMWE